VSRWAEAFDTIRMRDTVNTVDTMVFLDAIAPQSVNGVNSVSGGEGGGAEVTPPPPIAPAAEPDHPADDPLPPPTTLLPVIPLAEQVEALAQAMMSNPVYRITNPEKAMEYFRANALTRLCATADPLARGLLLGLERHRSAMAVHSRPTGR